ncbi:MULTISPECIES: polysaccharide lyase family 7 protein [unclassified Pseudomonas]|uniref:polysaccharide lyase family 7 protein n=1 Tax=unclassified Pseudomonas TaxID=196821 RepID=UPI002AC98377|nr:MULTISPECIES: polysaccharide lyase family 7 protein [unclassified Pseudomonas]MEB0048511.1 polysaccharide lyase family 7 protein [Pseudomonas sp. Dout3]MEB0099374.1 polysaccharide lyase family 7 protein [Pseudomonas sp. DC1.2]WPX61188.1 polysaccharide lyase family 7 protein [Pseudomonas sp. DC1.2]
MTVDISSFDIATPLPTSATNPVALELNGTQALVQCPTVISRLADGSIQLTAPTKGASSKSTHRTRCEWKESVYWTLTSAADHWNQQEMTLIKVNSAQRVVVSQMHVHDDVDPAIKVFWEKGSLTFAFRKEYNGADPTPKFLLGNVALGSKFQVGIHSTAAGVIVISARCNAASASSAPLQLGSSWSTKAFDFHGGIYNQIDYTDTTAPDDGSICIISQLTVRHI